MLLIGTVLSRVLLLRRTGTRAMHFGKLDKTDFLIPPVALFYFYYGVRHRLWLAAGQPPAVLPVDGRRLARSGAVCRSGC